MSKVLDDTRDKIHNNVSDIIDFLDKTSRDAIELSRKLSERSFEAAKEIHKDLRDKGNEKKD